MVAGRQSRMAVGVVAAVALASILLGRPRAPLVVPAEEREAGPERGEGVEPDPAAAPEPARFATLRARAAPAREAPPSAAEIQARIDALECAPDAVFVPAAAVEWHEHVVVTTHFAYPGPDAFRRWGGDDFVVVDDPTWPVMTDDELGRRHAMRRGWRGLRRAQSLRGVAALHAFDRARRDLSEGLMLPEMADPAERAALEEAIRGANAVVYGSTTPIPEVTEVLAVARGDYPRHVVDRRPFGPNAILYWNLRGDLDPRHLPANVPLTVPLEPLWLFVDRSWHALLVFLGESFVKEFPVAVGRPETPTRPGTYRIGEMLDLNTHRRPDLGDAWTALDPVGTSDWKDRVFLHGTDQPDSIGTDATRGSIRLSNADALEVLGWVNTHHGPERRVVVR